MTLKRVSVFGPLCYKEKEKIRELHKAGHGSLTISAILGRKGKSVRHFILKEIEGCPVCHNKLIENLYQRARDRGAQYYCPKCDKHISGLGKEVIIDG